MVDVTEKGPRHLQLDVKGEFGASLDIVSGLSSRFQALCSEGVSFLQGFQQRREKQDFEF